MAFAKIEQPTTFAGRCALARRIREELEVPLPIFVDGMDDASRALFSDLPSPAFVIDRRGRIADKLPWADPELLQKSVARIVAKDPIPAAKTGLQLGEREAIARRLVAQGKVDEAIGWLDAASDSAPAPIDLARAAITRVLACRLGSESVRTAAMAAAQTAAEVAWRADPARLTAARIELAEAGDGSKSATALWDSALAGLDPRAPAMTREWLVHQGDLAATSLPVPGEVFRIEGRRAFVIPPTEKVLDGAIPWVWYAPTLPNLPSTAERWLLERFTKAGIAIAGIDVGESYGSPDGQQLFSALYRELTTNRGFARQPVLLGRSRGGLMALGWAIENPDQVGGFAGIYPVCNLASYPGVDKAAAAYHLQPAELQAQLALHNPIDRLAVLAQRKVPLFAIHGDADQVVPLEANSGEVAKRYAALGGQMQLVVPPGQGHTMWSGFFQSEAMVAFVLANAKAR